MKKSDKKLFFSATYPGGDDGLGSVAISIFSGIAWCVHKGYTFIYAPLSLTKPSGSRSGFDYGIGRDKELNDFLGIESDEDYAGPIEYNHERWVAEVCYAVRPSIYYTPEVLGKIRKMYYSTEKPPKCQHDIAIHIRRGDVSAENRYSSRYTSNDFYVKLVGFLKNKYPDYSICIHSEGTVDDFKKLKNLDVSFSLSADIKKTFHDFVTAKVLVPAISDFSRAPALLSEGIIYHIPRSAGLNQSPLDHWNVIDKNMAIIY